MLASFDRVDQLRMPQIASMQMEVPDEYSNIITRADLVDKDTIKATLKRIKKEHKEEKKATKWLEQLVEKTEDYLNTKNHNNYLLNRLGALGQINNALETGEYINTPLAFCPEMPLIMTLYKHRNHIKNYPITTLNYNGQKLDVYNQPINNAARNAISYVANCGKPQNVAEDFLVKNTKMSLGQARSMLNTAGTIGLVA